MYIDRRKRKDGTVQYRFTYIDKDGVRRRYPQSKVPHIRNEEEAERFRKSKAAEFEAKKDYIERKLAWKSKHHDFPDLVKKYAEWQKQRAPNSWESCVSYLEQWVFPFFLTEKELGAISVWHLHFQEFRDWLGGPTAKERRGERGPLAISTRNGIINALNTFLKCMKTYNEIDPASAQTCEKYPEHMLNRRDIDDVIFEDERDRVVEKLRDIYEPAADFFEVLWHTGMRFAELFGLPITALFRGEVEAGPLRDELVKHGITYHGYIYLDSQPFFDDRRREEDKTIRRKPLKGCKEIHPKHARVIPVRDKRIWNILAKRYQAQMELFTAAKQPFGPNKADYVFFEDAEWNKTVVSIREAYGKLGMEPKGYHSCRHSLTTLLVGETRNYFLVRMITGHKSQKTFERYLHLQEQIARKVRAKKQSIELL